MIEFKEMNLSDEIHQQLDGLELDFAFQPIYRLKDMYLIGYEALMRPKNMTPLELIDEYYKKGELHTIELATLFGAWEAYRKRGYDTLLNLNSFPEECMTDDEELVFHECFPESQLKMILEILEYTTLDNAKWEIKKKQLKERQIKTALDDFGTGNNVDTDVVDIYEALLIKLDRQLIADIDSNEEMQAKVQEYLDDFHEKGLLVLAECVETEAELNYLKSIGVDFAQGYYLGRPQ